VHRSRRRILLAAGAICVIPRALAQTRSDLAREKRWADQVLPSLVVGDAVTLQTKDGVRFLALWALPERARGAVMLLHGPGLHPNHGITGELRVALVDRGFATLSLQLPVLPAEVDDAAAYQALYPEAGERIASGIAFLREKGFARVAVVSHAMGSGMFYAWWRASRDPAIAAWAALSFYGVFDEIARAPFPVLDIYGANDYRGIRGKAEDRAEVLATVRGAKQLAVPEGGYFLAGGEATVLKEVPAFLDSIWGQTPVDKSRRQ